MADKQTEKEKAAGLLGLMDPILREIAQKIAAKIPQDSAVRLPTVESVVGAAKGWIEAHAEKYSALASALIEKGTDLHDFFTTALAEQGPSSVRWADRFMEESMARLRSTENPEKELERIKTELQFRKELLEIMHAQIGKRISVLEEIQKAEQWLDQQALSLVPSVNELNQHLKRVRDNLRKKKKRRQPDENPH